METSSSLEAQNRIQSGTIDSRTDDATIEDTTSFGTEVAKQGSNNEHDGATESAPQDAVDLNIHTSWGVKDLVTTYHAPFGGGSATSPENRFVLVRSMDDRLLSLEQKLQRLEAKHEIGNIPKLPLNGDYITRNQEDEIFRERPYSPPPPPPPRTRSSSPASTVPTEDSVYHINVTPTINRLSGSDYRAEERSYKRDSNYDRSAIDILIGQAQSATKSRSKKRRTETFQVDPSVAGQYDSPDEYDSENQAISQIPDRIRIRSKILLDAMIQITGRSLPTNPDRNTNIVRPVVFIRPFKYLFLHEDEIRSRVKELEDLHKEGLLATSVEEDGADRDSLSDNDIESEDSESIDLESNNVESKEALAHLRLIIEILDNDLRPLLDLRRQIKEGTLKTIAFEHLWFLFHPGQEVLTSPPNDMPSQLYRVLHFNGGRRFLQHTGELIVYQRGPPPPPGASNDVEPIWLTRDQSISSFEIQCFQLDFDGSDYGPSEMTFAISPYDGERRITDLVVYPLNLRHDGAERKDFHVKRGRRFIELSHTAHMQYRGVSLDDRKQEIESQVIVDFAMASRHASGPNGVFNVSLRVQQPGRANLRETKEVNSSDEEVIVYRRRKKGRGEISSKERTRGRRRRRLRRNFDRIYNDGELDLDRAYALIREQEDILDFFPRTHQLSDDDVALFSFRVFGFVLRDRSWARLNIDHVTDVQPLEAGFDALVLPSGHRETLEALVRNHSRSTEKENATHFDLIPGKGKGLIILLHGEPGVGKTSTAESIAAHTKRPLFPITCGDIGETAERVENTLKNTFQLAHEWGCVLLLDEADVFLQRRNKTDLQRNSIVSVFLRVLEYYSGILFLTTNRIGTIDPAFKSRIHMSLYYPTLSRDATKEIWTWHIRNLAKKNKEMKIDKKEIFKFALAHYDDLEQEKAIWNGRQIRNAFQTASALAEYDALRNNQKLKVPEMPHLTADHFAKVAKASKDFDKYLKQTWGGHDERDLARRAQERLDHPQDHPPTSRARGIRQQRSPNARPSRDDDFPDDEEPFHDSADEKVADDMTRKIGQKTRSLLRSQTRV